jgi:hypothetical protein
MNRVIILEGADATGKTTLADRLVDSHGFTKVHTGVPKPKEDVFRSYTLTLWKALRSPEPIVLDRCYLGETIYGPVMRGASRLSETQLILLERLASANDVKRVITYNSLNGDMAQWRKKQDDYVDHYTHYVNIWNRYWSYQQGHSEYHKYSYHRPETFLNLFTPGLRLPANVIGSPQAKILIVGEQVNKKLTHTDWAFYSDKGSSGYLNEALQWAEIPERDLAFCNALNVNDKPKDLDAIVAKLPNFKVAIALGRTAQKILFTQDVTYEQVDHPSYWKRFQHGKMDDYAQRLKDIHKEYCSENAKSVRV